MQCSRIFLVLCSLTWINLVLSDSCRCGVSSLARRKISRLYPITKKERIIGGAESPPHGFPWLVRLKGGCAASKCGGALISARLIATAFHCTDDNNGDPYVPCDHSDGKRVAVIGAHDISSTNEESQFTIPIIDVQSPPDRKLRFKVPDSHDFAVAILKYPVTWSTHGISFGKEFQFISMIQCIQSVFHFTTMTSVDGERMQQAGG